MPDVLPFLQALARLERVGTTIQPDNMILVDSMHERKEIMASLATLGFIALPGGFGTFDETVEMITWTQVCAWLVRVCTCVVMIECTMGMVMRFWLHPVACRVEVLRS